MIDQYPVPRSGHGPVLLDLDGDGHIDLRPLDLSALATGSSTTFDWNSDGAKDGTAWVGPTDGFLAIDLGADGQSGPDGSIDQAKELHSRSGPVTVTSLPPAVLFPTWMA